NRRYFAGGPPMPAHTQRQPRPRSPGFPQKTGRGLSRLHKERADDFGVLGGLRNLSRDGDRLCTRPDLEKPLLPESRARWRSYSAARRPHSSPLIRVNRRFDQSQEPECASGEARGGEGLGQVKLIYLLVLCS